MIKAKFLFIRFLVLSVKNLRPLGSVAIRLTQLTGKSRYPIHPKHLVEISPPWYLKYLSRGDIVLDLGCGNGQNTLKAAKKIKKIIGLDYNGEGLILGSRLAKESGISNIEFKYGNIEQKLDLPDRSFSKILFLDTLEHINNEARSLKEVSRILKAGGLLLL